MNKVIETIMNHRSIREYETKAIKDEYLQAIVEGVQAAPTSVNGQQLSVIVIQDQVKRDKIAQLSGGQKWIAQAPVFLLFVADYNRAKIAMDKCGESLVITESLESIMVSSVDVGLAMGNAIAIAESLELGIVPIGAVRRDPQAMIDLFELPEFVFPVAGLVVGYPKGLSAKKPRLPKEAVIHNEVYNNDLSGYIDDYDKTISNYMKERTQGESDRNWSDMISGFYKQVYFPQVYPVIRKQGFDNNK